MSPLKEVNGIVTEETPEFTTAVVTTTSNTKTIAVENARVNMNGYNVSLAQSISLDSSLKNEIFFFTFFLIYYIIGSCIIYYYKHCVNCHTIC